MTFSPRAERALTILGFLTAAVVLGLCGNETLAAAAMGAASGIAMPMRAPGGTAAVLAIGGAAIATAAGV